MLPYYEDLLEAAKPNEPLWYDANGVPRFAPFGPGMLGVYDKWAVLYEIACQACGVRFLVGEGWAQFEFCRHGVEENGAPEAGLHFGDPPRHDCVGDTMNCVDLRIVEVWEKPFLEDWIRRPRLEIELEGER